MTKIGLHFIRYLGLLVRHKDFNFVKQGSPSIERGSPRYIGFRYTIIDELRMPLSLAKRTSWAFELVRFKKTGLLKAGFGRKQRIGPRDIALVELTEITNEQSASIPTDIPTPRTPIRLR
jgi:hypothetical protein